MVTDDDREREDVRLGRDGGTRSRRVRRDGGAMQGRERVGGYAFTSSSRCSREDARGRSRARGTRMSRVRCGCAESLVGLEVAGARATKRD